MIPANKENLESIEQSEFSQIEALGLDTTKALNCGLYYIVEGDIILDKENLQNHHTRVYRADNYTSNHRNIVISYDSSVPSSSKWRSAISQVISFYNTNTGLQMKLSQDNNSNCDIAIKLDYIIYQGVIVTNAIACGTFPQTEGSVGNKVIINKAINTGTELSYSVDYIAHILKHEIGHCLGLRHSDCLKHDDIADGEPDYGASLVDGTIEDDEYSYMNSGPYNKGYGYSSYDIIALKTIWPYQYRISFQSCSLNSVYFEYHTTPYKLSRFHYPTMSGKEFAGFSHTTSAYVPFSYDENITNNMTLYATWRNPSSNKTTILGYSTNGASSKTFTVNNTYVAKITCEVNRGLNTWEQLSMQMDTYTKLDKVVSGSTTELYRIVMKNYILGPHGTEQTKSQSFELVLDPGTYILTSSITTAYGDQSLAAGNHGITYSTIEY